MNKKEEDITTGLKQEEEIIPTAREIYDALELHPLHTVFTSVGSSLINTGKPVGGIIGNTLALAISQAMNHTWVKGIDPSQVEELWQTLNALLVKAEKINHHEGEYTIRLSDNEVSFLQSVLNNARIKR